MGLLDPFDRETRVCAPATDFIIPNQNNNPQGAVVAAPAAQGPAEGPVAPAVQQPPAPQPSRRQYAHDHSSVTPMTMVKTLVALATERMLLKTSGPTFLRGIEFMYAAGLAPDRLSVMMTSSHKYVLQFHSKCDIRPFAANYPNFGRVLRGIVHVREWRIKSIEFVNVAFYMRDVDNLERAIEKLGVELVLLRNCTYPGVQRGDEAVKFLSALNRKKQAVVCEYGDDRLKHRIGRRASGHRARRASRNGQEVVVQPAAGERIPVGALIIGPPPGAVQQGEAVPVAEAPARRPVAVNAEPPRHLHIVHPERGDAAERDRAVGENGRPAVVPEVIEPQIRVLGQQERNRSPGRVMVGAHVYEFRAIDAPNGDAPPQVHNVNHLINVLHENSSNDVRVIVLPSRGGVAGGPLNNNQDFVYRQISQQQANAMGQQGGAAGNEPHYHIAPIREGAAGRMGQRNQYDQQPAQLIGPQIGPIHRPLRPQQAWNAYPVVNAIIQQNRGIGGHLQRHAQAQAQAAAAAASAPAAVGIQMFGDAVNEPQVQRNGDDSNDSTDREDHQEMYDPEQQRNEALRDLVADPEAQPNFAPVEAQAVDLDMLEEEGEDDEEVMEGVVVNGQPLLINEQQR